MRRKKIQTNFFPLVVGILALSIIGLGIARLRSKSQILLINAQNPQKMVMADFYWWYPWYGMQWKGANGTLQAPLNMDGYVGQEAFRYSFSFPTPYLRSSERPTGLEDPNGDLATKWFKDNFVRAAANGIDVLTPMTRPDLGMWSTALGEMIRAQKELKAEGRAFPKIAFHYDGVEYWDGSPNDSQLTGPGADFDAIWKGTQSTFDTVFANLKSSEISTYLYNFPDPETYPIYVYRVEGSWSNVATSDWWVSQLKTNFSNKYPGKKLYLILDDLWCDQNYGVNNTIVNHTCNADNYYFWGSALLGTKVPMHAKPDLKILSVGPGYDDRMLRGGTTHKDRVGGDWYSSNFEQAGKLGADWILIETFNFGEEGTGIDTTSGKDSYGDLYLKLTKQLSTTWKGGNTNALSGQFTFGLPGDTPVVGNWYGGVIDTPAGVRGDNWREKKTLGNGGADQTITINTSNLPKTGQRYYLSCDWLGTGKKTPGVVVGGTWYVRKTNTSGVPDLVFTFGNPSDIPVCGNWSGKESGIQTAGVYRNGNWMLRNSNNTGNADITYVYGLPSDIPVVGHWTGTKQDFPGIYRNGAFLLRNSHSTGNADQTISFGSTGDIPIIGDWSGRGKSSVGVVRGNLWMLKL